jgi:septum formation protein
VAGWAQPLLLASTSPQRRAILAALGISFTVVAPRYDEADVPGMDAAGLALHHARGKAASVRGDGVTVLGVDTVVAVDGRVLGKPADRDEARRSIQALSGRDHHVHSGLAVRAQGVEVCRRAVTRVRFRALSASEVDRYLDTGEWEGRAGGYAVQAAGAGLVEAIEGDHSNVVGLPVAALVDALGELAGC